MPTIAAQAGTTDQVIDLHAEAWTEPRSPGSGQTDHGAVCCPGCARFDQWVYRLGGYASTRFIALCNEARDVAGPGGQFRYLDLAQEVDAEHTAGAGRWLADETELANTGSVRQAAEDAAADCLQQVTEVKLAADALKANPSVKRALDSNDETAVTATDVDLGLRAAMGLVNRGPTQYEASLPQVSDLGRMMGLKQ